MKNKRDKIKHRIMPDNETRNIFVIEKSKQKN
jgi:hypothetical protein